MHQFVIINLVFHFFLFIKFQFFKFYFQFVLLFFAFCIALQKIATPKTFPGSVEGGYILRLTRERAGFLSMEELYNSQEMVNFLNVCIFISDYQMISKIKMVYSWTADYPPASL